jgi:hypothetical protein
MGEFLIGRLVSVDLLQTPGARVPQRDEPESAQPCVATFQRQHHLPHAEYDLITVGETPFTTDLEVLVPYSIPANKELQMVFTFEMMDIDGSPPLVARQWKLTELKHVTEKCTSSAGVHCAS